MAVYTPLTHASIAAFLAQHYDVGTLHEALGIAQGVENTNYRITTVNATGAQQTFILTLYEKRVNPADLPFFIGLMQHVASRGVACPAPIARRDGARFGAYGNKQCALVSFLEGTSSSAITEAQAGAVGAALAALHQAAADFTGMRANALSLAGWRSLYEKTTGRLGEIEPGLEELVREELAFAAQHFPPSGTLPSGVIHADLFPDNVFFAGDSVSGLIDFYFACNDAWAYDVAITLNAWCFEPDHRFNAAKAHALLTAYQAVRPFSAAETQAFPALLRGASLRFLLTRAHDWQARDPAALVQPHDPREYATKLRFHQQQHIAL